MIENECEDICKVCNSLRNKLSAISGSKDQLKVMVDVITLDLRAYDCIKMHSGS
jgi:hypothetical protein